MIIRVEKTKNYTVMSNYHLRDTNLSLKSKGLLSLILSLPEDWDYSINGLASICKDGSTAVRTALTELEEYKYIHRDKIRNELGQIVDYEYIISEIPMNTECEPFVENQIVDNQIVENRIQINIDKQNKEENKYRDVEEEHSQQSKKDSTKKEIAEKYMNDYVSICTTLPQPKKLTQSRIDAIYRLCSKYNYEDILDVLHKANESDFLSGRNGKWQHFGFDWLLKENNFIKTLEGNYDNRGGSNQYRKENVFGEYQTKTNKVNEEDRENAFLPNRTV